MLQSPGGGRRLVLEPEESHITRGLREAVLILSRSKGFTNLIICYFLCFLNAVNINMPSLNCDELNNLSRDLCCQGLSFRWSSNFCQFDLMHLS